MRVATVSYAATVACVRAAIAAYAQAVNDGRHCDISALLCKDGLGRPVRGRRGGRR